MGEHTASVLVAVMIAAGLVLSAAPTRAAIELPFQESFSSGKLDGWTMVKSEGDELVVRDGRLDVNAGDDSYAHIQRELGVDFVTVTARLPGLTSLYVAWDSENWCGVGKISPTPFGRYYSTVTENGKTVETNHQGCVAWKPHIVRLQIGSDCVRMSYSEDGSQWFWLRALPRPASFSGAPKLVAFGKHYPAGTKPFSSAMLDTTRGPKYGGSVSEIRMEATPEKDLKMTAVERKELTNTVSDRVGSILLARDEDPTFASVCNYYPAMRLPREIVGVPERMVQIGVDYLARLDASPWAPPTCWFLVGDPQKPLGEGKEPIAHRLLDGYLPVDTVTTERSGVKYELTVFGWSQTFAPEEDMYAYVRLRARGANLPKQMGLGYNSKDGQKTSSWEMTSSGSGTEVLLRFKYPEPWAAEQVTAAEFAEKQAAVVSCWRGRISPAERFDIPDKRVSEAYRAWIMYSFLNAAKLNGHLEIHDGSGFYGSMFGQSMTLHAMAMDMYGMPDYVERIIETMLHYTNADGLYYQDCGLQDHGGLLACIAHHYQATGNAEWLRSVSPKVLKACEWLVKQRADAPREGVTKGLIKFRPYNDAREPAYNYLGNCQAAVGLRDIAKALTAIGMTADGKRYAAEALSYRKDILASMEAAAFQDGDATIIPLEPDTHRIEKLSYNQGGDYYGLVVGSLLGTGFMEPDDKRTWLFTDLMEKRKGLVAGVCEFMEGIDHAYTYGYWMTQMQRDDIKKVLLGFWSSFAYGMTRDTYSPVEVSHIKTGENHLTLPHTYSLTEQLRLLRNMMVRENANELWIGRAIPRDWLKPGKSVAADEAPTQFGPVSFRITSSIDRTMSVKLAPPTRRVPSKIRIRLRHPESLSIAGVDGAGSAGVEVSGDTITLTRCTNPVELRVRFK